MSTRKEFLKQMMLLSGSAGLSWTLPESIQRAISIDPKSGSSFLDAEHVVILMQENRSFDHCFGTLQGVRGYNDPRAITLPNKNPVWLQSSEAGATYSPFRFDINDTSITWMGSVPHSRSSQVDADNRGKYDQWIEAKRPYHDQYSDMPLTMGHYTRDDLPFNYAFADAFTVCDQNFCSAMTSTWPNRLLFWSGTVRGERSGDAKAFIRNDIPWGSAHWKTMPEWLEENDVSWRIYQNDISTGGGFHGQERAWLSNFGLNPLEFLSQYNARFSPRYVQGLKNQVQKLPVQISKLADKMKSISTKDAKYEKIKRAIKKKQLVLSQAREGLDKWSQEAFANLSQKQKNLFNKAFTINDGDPNYHELTTLRYQSDGEERELPIPKGDILHQFRKDVKNGDLPVISWLAPPQNFSDHPSAPWYGSWYTSEVLNILTEDPEVWKKTVFIYTYDENDGYFDHVPPFTAPNPADKKTGKCSPSINVTGEEWIRREDKIREGVSKKRARSGPVGMGFRVPMIIASPWSRGGRVCSEVFDHTSTLQFLEHFVNEKYDKQIKVTNISDWRRAVSGNLTSVFRTEKEREKEELPFLAKDPYIEKIHNAKFKKEPSDFKQLSDEEIEQIKKDPASSPFMPNQEKGIRPSCGLPYELYVDGGLTNDNENFRLRMKAGDEAFGSRSAGSPFKVYAPGKYLTLEGEEKDKNIFESARSWDYAVSAGDELTESYPLNAFKGRNYQLQVYGPNGFFREFTGNKKDPAIQIECKYEEASRQKNRFTGNAVLRLVNQSQAPQTVQIIDNSYGNTTIRRKIPVGEEKSVILDLQESHGWYDATVTVNSSEAFARQYAGRVETGEEQYSDPAMGKDM